MNQNPLDDTALILAYRNGSPTALIELWLRYDRLVYGVAHSLLCQREMAEDVRQEVFLKMYNQLDTLRVTERLGNWLHSITRNTCHSLLRRHRPAVSIDGLADAIHAEHPSFATDLEYRDQRTWLRQAIDALPEDYRVAMELHYFEEQSLFQIARFLDITESTVKWRLYRGREMLKRKARTLK